MVAPFAGAWIEILWMKRSAGFMRSLPSRERGLKFRAAGGCDIAAQVAPFAGAWIEMRYDMDAAELERVAPFAGAWIEICVRCDRSRCPCVAPFAGAWIEMLPI